MKLFALVLLGLAGMAGCGACAEPELVPEAAVAPKKKSMTATTAAQMVDAIYARLRDEAANRPTGTPTVEAVLAALNAGGVAVYPGQQSLAAVTEATYCWQSRSTDGAIAFSICEYPSDAAVKKSQEVSLTKFPGMGERTFLVQGHTMMTIKQHKPEGAAVIEKVKPILASLK